jgi:putative hydrolase of the HAD superfamily
MIQAIVYDAVGTLLHVTPSVAEVYAEVGARFGSKYSAQEIAERFQTAFALEEQRDQRAGWKTNEMREKLRWRGIVISVLDDTRDPGGCAKELFDIFSKPTAWTHTPEAADLIANVQERGIRQGLASNFDARLRPVVQGMPALATLQPIIISSEVGWRKPAPQFFAKVSEILQLPPGDILFVGDDRVNDFEPARAAGMKSVLFDPAGKHAEVGAERIERLEEVLSLLE